MCDRSRRFNHGFTRLRILTGQRNCVSVAQLGTGVLHLQGDTNMQPAPVHCHPFCSQGDRIPSGWGLVQAFSDSMGLHACSRDGPAGGCLGTTTRF